MSNDLIQQSFERMEAGLCKFTESLATEVKASLSEQRQELAKQQKMLEQVAEQANVAAAMLKADGDRPTEVKAMKESLDEFTASLEEYNRRVEAIENEVALTEHKAGRTPAELKSLAELIGETELYKTEWSQMKTGPGAVFNPNFAKSLQIPLLSRNELDLGRSAFKTEHGIKANILGSTELGDWSIPAYRQGLIEARPRAMGLLQRLNRFTLLTEQYRFKREAENSRRAYLHTTLSAAVTAAATSANLTDTRGFAVGMTVRFVVTGGTISKVLTAVDHTALTVSWTGAFHATLTGAAGDFVQSEQFGVTAESADKPYSYFEVEEEFENMKTLAIMVGMTQQRINVLPQLQQFIERHLRARAMANTTQHVLYGTGTADYLQGFFGYTDAQDFAWSTDAAYGDTRVDAAMRAGEDLEAEGYTQLSLGCHPKDWGLIVRAKNADGDYLYRAAGNTPHMVLNTESAKAIGSIPVYTDHYFVRGDFLLADLMEAAELIDQGTGGLSYGLVNDQFRKNQITARYEETMLLAILTKYAFVLGQWDSAPAAP